MYNSIFDLFNEIKTSGKDWLKSQFKVSALTFLLLTAGLFIADYVCEKKYGSGLAIDFLIPIIAFVIAIIDAVPVLGISACMLPWAALVTIFAEPRTKGLALLLVYICVMVIKQISEPFIRGKSLGVSPIEEILASAFGWLAFSWMGALGSGIGLIAVPIIYTVGKKAYMATHSDYFPERSQRSFKPDSRRDNAVDITDDIEDVDKQ